MELRPARVDDLGQIYDVWYATEVVGLADPPPPRTMPWFGHLLSVGQLTVAVDGGVIVGFAGILDYGPCVALSDLFVRPSWQSQGVGGTLLDAVLLDGRPAVTMASADPRAVASYVRRGLLPRWPAYYIAATPEQLRDADRFSGRQATVERMPAGDYPWDLPGDAAHYGELGAIPLEVRRAGQHVIGRALVLTGSPQRLSHPDTTELLETSADAGTDAADVVLAVVGHVLADGATRVLVQVPGPHPALAELLRLGFRITDADMACATDASLFADPALHTMHGESRVQRA